MAKTIKNKRTAIDAFLEHKATIDQELKMLKAMADDHFETNPDELNWTDVAELERIAQELSVINDRLYKRGEYA